MLNRMIEEGFNQTKTSKLHPKIGLKLFRLDRCFFITSTYKQQAHTNILKVKSTITRYVKCFVPGISISKNLFKEIESVNSNAPVEALALNRCLLGETKYIYNITQSLDEE